MGEPAAGLLPADIVAIPRPGGLVLIGLAERLAALPRHLALSSPAGIEALLARAARRPVVRRALARLAARAGGRGAAGPAGLCIDPAAEAMALIRARRLAVAELPLVVDAAPADPATLRAAAAGPARPAPPGGGTPSVAQLSLAERFERALKLTAPKLSGAARREFEALLAPEALAMLVGALVILAGAHLAGVGFAVDAVLIAVGLVFLGWEVIRAVGNIIAFIDGVVRARSEADLDRAAEALAAAVAQIGVGALVALLARGAGRVTRGARAAEDAGDAARAAGAADPPPRPARGRRAADETPVRPPPRQPLPRNPDDLLQKGYRETSHPEAARHGHRTFENPETGDVVRFDKGRPGAPGFEGVDHYHRSNPNATGRHDQYLDADGNPVARGSRESHILPEEDG